MRRRVRTLIILAGVVALLAAGVALASWYPQRPAATEADQPQGFVAISEFDRGLLRTVTLEGPSGTIELSNDRGSWMISKPAELAVKEGPLQDLLYTLSNLSSERVVAEDPEDLAPYGLAPPAVTARMSLSTGESRELYLGDMTPAGDSYYLMAKGDPRVFTVRAHHGTYLRYLISDLWERADRTPINSADVVYLRIARRGTTVLELRETRELYSADVEFRGTTLSVVYPYADSPRPVDSYFLNDFVLSLGSLAPEVAFDATPADRAAYGLDPPRWELSLTDIAGNSLEVSVGNEETGSVYLQFANDPIVYAGDPRLLTILDVDPFRFTTRFAVIVRLDKVDLMSITTGAVRHELRIQRPSPGSEEGAKWLMDGRPIDERAFKGFYQEVASLQIDAPLQSAVQGAPAVRIVFELNSGPSRTYGVDFVPYSQEFYALLKGGRSDSLVNRQQLAVMLQHLEALAASTTATP